MPHTAKQPSRRFLWAIIILVAVMAAMALIYAATRETPKPYEKTLQIAVVDGNGAQRDFTLRTNAGTLREALQEAGLIAGNDTANGLFVTTVNGVAADEGKQEWWRFTKSGEMLLTGVDATVVADGDNYEITLMSGY
ncbi:MAG: DUF4430 domain-containing protein [Clostridiales bacterium]|jgi:hypothetical protein|nr:DUF4430 domain-containing protein [Clostridiales bacterium]